MGARRKEDERPIRKFTVQARDDGGWSGMFVVDVGENIYISGMIQSRNLMTLPMDWM